MLFSDIATFTVVKMEMTIGMLMFSASQQCVLDVFDKVGTIKNREGRSRTLSIDIIQA